MSITPAWEQKVTIAPGDGVAHASRDFGDIYNSAGELACEVVIKAPKSGKLIFNFASVKTPSEFLSVGPWGTGNKVKQQTFYTYDQLETCAEQYVVKIPNSAKPYVFVVPNFRSAGRYLHTWFTSDGSAGTVEATVTVSAKSKM